MLGCYTNLAYFIIVGKTEATKVMLQFLAARAEGTVSDTSVQQQILDANPVLEAFGMD